MKNQYHLFESRRLPKTTRSLKAAGYSGSSWRRYSSRYVLSVAIRLKSTKFDCEFRKRQSGANKTTNWPFLKPNYAGLRRNHSEKCQEYSFSVWARCQYVKKERV